MDKAKGFLLLGIIFLLCSIVLLIFSLNQVNPVVLQGPQGIPGIRGERGISGIQGLQGERGDIGFPGISWGKPISSSYTISFYWGSGQGRSISLYPGDRMEFSVSFNYPVKCSIHDSYGNYILNCVVNTSGGPSSCSGSIIAASPGNYEIETSSAPGFSYNSQTLVTGTVTYTIYPNLGDS